MFLKDASYQGKMICWFVLLLLTYVLFWSTIGLVLSGHQVIEQVEKVQRRFTKRLFGMRCLSYDERLQRLGLLRPELRRLHLDLIFCYKIVFGLVSVNF